MPSLEIVQVESIKPPATSNDDSRVAGVEIAMAVDLPVADVASTQATGASLNQNLMEESSPSTELEGDLDSTGQPAASESLSQKTAPSPESGRQQRRQVTPSEDELTTSISSSTNRKSQQKKVNQLMLSAFFHKASKKESPKPALNTKISTPASISPPKSIPQKKESPAHTVIVSSPTLSLTKGDSLQSTLTTETKSTTKEVIESKERPKRVSRRRTSTRHAKSTTDSPSLPRNDPKVASKTALEHESSPRQVLALSPTIDLTLSPNHDQNVGLKAETKPMLKNDDLSDERKALLKNHSDMRKRYQQRAEELVRDARSGLDEEDFDMPLPEQITDLPTDQEFPDVVASNMAMLIEGSKSSLSKLVTIVCGKLKECHNKEWSQESVSTKIKVMAERKPYLGSATAFKRDIHAKYEDENIDRMWRWEVGILEILPSAILPKVRRARSSRRKLMNHYSAIQKLIQSLNDADHQVWNMQCKKLDTSLSKVGKDEEKVLKFEREAEKQRLVLQAKKKKEQEQKAKRKEKEQLAEEKRKEKERKRVEAEKKKIEKEKEKQETAEAKEVKRKKAAEKERQEQEQKDKLKKQKATFKSFFANSTTKEAKSTADENQIDINGISSIKEVGMVTTDPQSTFDPESFRASLNSRSSKSSEALFQSLSFSALQSRKRRTRSVPVSVYVTVIPEEQNAFDAQPFAEQQTIFIPNKYRFLSFHEDCRPAYHGTWSKKSTIVTGRTPFNKDTAHLDYDYDSEAEWEEGDDEVGEDVEDEAKNQEDDDEGDAKMYDYDDGFCVADDRYLDIDEDVDEETKVLYKKKLQHGDCSEVTANRICILAPQMGGIPSDKASMEIEGFEKQEVTEMLRGLTGKQITKDFLWLDAFPPEKLDEIDPAPDATTPATNSTSKDEYTVEEMRLLASFAHHCPLNSKEKLIEELRNANVDIFSSRAKAIRKLDSIATKKRHPSGAGVYWEVSKDVLLELGLHEILSKKLEVSEAKCIAKSPSSSGKGKKRKTSGSSSPPSNKKKPSPPSSSKGQKRKSPCSSSPADDKKKPSQKKAKTVQDRSPASEGESSPKSTSPKKVHASATLIMNFLQPRKKPKAGG